MLCTDASKTVRSTCSWRRESQMKVFQGYGERLKAEETCLSLLLRWGKNAFSGYMEFQNRTVGRNCFYFIDTVGWPETTFFAMQCYLVLNCNNFENHVWNHQKTAFCIDQSSLLFTDYTRERNGHSPTCQNRVSIGFENLKPFARLASINRNKMIVVRLMWCFWNLKKKHIFLIFVSK